MDGSIRLGNRLLQLARCFEGSRVEQALLASAYEHATPLLQRPRSLAPVALDSSPPATEQRQFAAVGG
jgi:hypothetical protein